MCVRERKRGSEGEKEKKKERWMAITYVGASVAYSRNKREFNIWAVEDIPECLYILEHYPPPLVFLYNIIDLTVAD